MKTATKRKRRRRSKWINSSRKYLFIQDDVVIARAGTTIEAIKIAKQIPDAQIIWESGGAVKDLDDLKRSRRFEIEFDRRCDPNPVATILEQESNWLACSLEDDIKSVVPEFHAGCSFNQGYNNDEKRLATNEECCEWRDTANFEFCFDIRKNMPEQVKAWLKELAAKLIEASDKIIGQDLRNLKIIRRIVREDGLAQRMVDEDLRISWDNKKIITTEEYDAQYETEKAGAA